MSDGLKRCLVCGVEKSYSEFYKDCSRPDGLEYRCKTCSKEIRKKRVTDLNFYRTNCEKCGESRKYLIDFHHINPSEKEFTIGLNKWSSKKISEEVKKCVCLCKNCHCEFHYLYGKNPTNPSLALNDYLGK